MFHKPFSLVHTCTAMASDTLLSYLVPDMFLSDVVNRSWEMLLCVVLYPVVGHGNMFPLMHAGCVSYVNVVSFLLAIT